MTHNHPYHLVNFSPWPLTGSLGTCFMMIGLSSWFTSFNFNILIQLGLSIIALTMYQWWRDITRESTFQGLHSLKVNLNMRWGMILFIVSEVLFFFSFFWSFFHSSLSPNVELGCHWPPNNIISFNPFHIPLLNTLILLMSGISVTWAHHSIIENKKFSSFWSLATTIFLGVYFTSLQAIEYLEAPFSIADSIYGASFFVATGFHGLHVIIGTLFLMINLIRLKMSHLSQTHHFGFEAAAWYWHFVDVVWIFLYTFMYWWAN
uniref:Cytochrome c oxidase subunit 3 n=1 Tax=Diplectrona hexapetala (nom. nud.) TaxID=2904920 RepID=A0A9E8RTR5_9NEOP|nr:cytochrome c oxidase subunit III [Diplectrona hexapetala (nom. nud.)]UZZ43862.1 cytochrome c oxidase subunit III [Diplectrona hexapetala (nom. nud.)]